MTDKTLVFIPTYNERDNVEKICHDILRLGLDLDMLFMDDNSPDGTGVILDTLSERYSNVYVAHRTGKLGIGSAHMDGINWAYDQEYSTLITMDCDFTHQPESIPDFISKSDSFDIVVGSRFMFKKSLCEWNLFRKAMTFLGHFLTTNCLKMTYDATGAYRLYRLDRIPSKVFHIVNSKTYSFFFESLYILNINKYSIVEIPIELPARTYGHSKMSLKEVLKSVSHLLYIYLMKIIDVDRFLVDENCQPENSITSLENDQEWDEYWKNKKQQTLMVYDLIAAFYRKFIIKRTLNYFIKKQFKKDSKLLHAGCGSGQVDVDLYSHASITAIDISKEALSFYKKANKGVCELLHGSIFEMPVEDESFDGVYNLGVFEHFSGEDIHKILVEFHRVLKPEGKIVIFWPPRYGLSVAALKIAHYILNNLFKRSVSLHPNEPSLLKSRKQAQSFLEASKFELVEYYFGAKDLFTQAIIVGRKV